jgi:DNA-binding NarL/FixJ family response regulator
MERIGARVDTCCMNTHAAKNVFIVEDSPQVRQRLIELLSDVEDVHVVGQATTARDAMNGIQASRPDYVVLDYQLEVGTGVDVLKGVRSAVPGTRFIMLTNHASAPLQRVCMAAGADAFFDKTTEFGKVKEMIAGVCLLKQVSPN